MSRRMPLFIQVFRKEATDGLRDRKAMTTALLMPLMAPAMIVMFFALFERMNDKLDAPHVPVAGQEHAPALLDAMRAEGFHIEAAPADVDAAVKDGDVDVVVRVDAGFGEALRAGKPAVVEVISDSTRTDAAATVGAVTSFLQQYGAKVGSLRLLARGVDPSLMQGVVVSARDVSSSSTDVTIIFGMLPFFLLAACFAGGAALAADLTAGERERNSLEPLLTTPTSPWSILAGKVMAVTAFAFAITLLTSVGFVVAVRSLPFERIGLHPHLDFASLALLAVLLFPVAVLGATMEVFVGLLTKSFKAAQSALQFLALLPMVPGMYVSLMSPKPQLSTMLPLLGESMMMMQIVRGEDVNAGYVVVGAAGDFVVAGIFFIAARRVFGPRLLQS